MNNCMTSEGHAVFSMVLESETARKAYAAAIARETGEPMSAILDRLTEWEKCHRAMFLHLRETSHTPSH